MPDPIQSLDPSLCSLPDDVTVDENNAQMCLSAAHPSASSTPTSAPAPSALGPRAPASPPSPAVSALVSRFTLPSGVHTPVEPSLAKAMLKCTAEEGNLVGTAGLIIAAAPETVGASLAGGFAIINAARIVRNCLADNEAQQIVDGNRANQVADCRSEGAIPLTTTDGAVVCAKQP
jgi:hypothetical protein